MTSTTRTAQDEAWDAYVLDIVESIGKGYLDSDIRMIARACFDRRDVIKEKNIDTSDPWVIRGGMFPPTRVGQVPCQETDCRLSAGHGGAHWKTPDIPPGNTTAPRTARKVAVAAAASAPKARTRKRVFTKADSTFRFTDGNLYHRSDVIGKILFYPDDHRYRVKVQGVGPKACKVAFVDSDGEVIPDDKAARVPTKYRVQDPKKGTIIKNPIFMHLNILTAVVATLTPAPEGADA